MTHLDLSDNRIGPQGVKALSNSFCQNVRFQELNLANNVLGAQGASALSKAVSCSGSKLTHVNISGNRLVENGDQGEADTSGLAVLCNGSGTDNAKHAEGLVSPNCAVTHLHLGSNNLGSAGADVVGRMLRSNAIMTQLNLSGPDQNLGAMGVRLLAVHVSAFVTYAYFIPFLSLPSLSCL